MPLSALVADPPTGEPGRRRWVFVRVRVAVQPGGCSGLRYQLFFDERYLDGDQTYEFGGVEVIVDRMSGPYLEGATIDFSDTIEKQGFTIDNPNAGGSCACGDSFH